MPVEVTGSHLGCRHWRALFYWPLLPPTSKLGKGDCGGWKGLHTFPPPLLSRLPHCWVHSQGASGSKRPRVMGTGRCSPQFCSKKKCLEDCLLPANANWAISLLNVLMGASSSEGLWAVAAVSMGTCSSWLLLQELVAKRTFPSHHCSQGEVQVVHLFRVDRSPGHGLKYDSNVMQDFNSSRTFSQGSNYGFLHGLTLTTWPSSLTASRFPFILTFQNNWP